jgi:hypothetical protein
MRRIGTLPAQTCAPVPATLAGEGGGFIPTLDLGGGARARLPRETFCTTRTAAR